MGGNQSLSFPLGAWDKGNPSPNLFILGSEMLMRLINKEISPGNLQGVKIASSAPPKMAELSTLKKCLERYCEWSRQEISLENSGLFPSKGVSQQFLNQVKHCWGIKKISSKAKYLGVLLFLTNNRSRDLASIKERLENKLSSWKSNSLSQVGRATLIKSVAQSMPTYSMSVLQFPKLMCEEMDAVVRRFWWNVKSKDGQYFTPITWSSCVVKSKQNSCSLINVHSKSPEALLHRQISLFEHSNDRFVT